MDRLFPRQPAGSFPPRAETYHSDDTGRPDPLPSLPQAGAVAVPSFEGGGLGNLTQVRGRSPVSQTVTALLWSWGITQYPCVLPGLALAEASATENVLVANAVAVVIRDFSDPFTVVLYTIFHGNQFAKHY
jgi:hypothetical protein